MACSSCNSGNSLSSCGCVDNCPTKTSEFTFDGVFSSIPVPAGSTLNEVLLLMETFTMNSIGDLNIEYELTDANCLGLVAGTYSYQQMIDAIISVLCALNSSYTSLEIQVLELETNNVLEWNDIPLVNGWVEVDPTDNPAQYAIQNELMYLKGEIEIDESSVLNTVFWSAVPMTGITRDIETMAYEKTTIGSALMRLSSGQFSYQGPVLETRTIVLDSIPVIRLTN